MKPEEALHCSVAKWLDIALSPPIFWTTFPAGGGGKVRGAKLKAMGLKAGVPDLMVIAPDKPVLFVELKVGKNKTTAIQDETIEALRKAGCPTRVCRSIGEVAEFLRSRDIPVRATV